MKANKLHRVLYVEDDPDIQTITKMSLETVGGLSVETASSGMEALTIIKNDPPQLVLLDVMMPGMDGPATLKCIRELPNGKSIPIVFFTAKAQPNEVESYKELGAIGVIVKPFDPMTLPDEVQSLWKQVA